MKDSKPTRAETLVRLGMTMNAASKHGVTDAEWAEAMLKVNRELPTSSMSVRDRKIAHMRTARDMLIVEIESYPAETTEEQDMLDNIVCNLRADR